MKKTKNFFSRFYLGLVLLFFYLPILYVVVFSFNDSKSLTNFTGFSLQWYERMFNDRTMMEAIGYTVIIAVIATIVSTVIGTITAIGLSKSKRILRDVVLQINDLPMLNPDIVTAIGLMLLFTSLNVETGFWTLLLAHIIFCIPYVILSIMPKIRQLDNNLAEAALDLGATPWQALIQVIVPQIMPGIVSGALIAFTMSFDDFVISFFTTGPGVNNISTLVYAQSKRINPSINALSAMIVLVVTVVLILVNVVPIIKEKQAAKRPVDAEMKTSKPLIPLVAGITCAALVVCLFGFQMLSKSSSTSDKDPMSLYGCNVLNVYNAGEYIGEEVNSKFEEEYNVRINYSMFASNEEMYTKLMGGSKYDVLIPSDYMIERLIDEDLIQPLDKARITNWSNIYSGILNQAFDPNSDYSVPYFWGTVGILYNHNNVDPSDVESQGYNILHNEKYKGKVFVYDSERDSFMMAFKALGYSMNTENSDEIQEAYQWLLEMDDKVSPAYVTDEVIDAMLNGERDIAVVYSGDAAYILSENEEMSFYMPESGTNFWVDAMVIPSNSECAELAHEYINFMVREDIAYENSSFVGYASNVESVLEQMTAPGGDYEGNEAYLVRVGYEKDEVFRHNEKLKKTLSDLWIKVKNR